MIFPDKFCLWNNKPKKVLPFLGLTALPAYLYKSGSATGKEYLQCLTYLDLVKNELSQFGVKDYLNLDVFFSHIFEDVMPEQERASESSKTSKTSVWIVRAGGRGRQERIALDSNVVTIGWNELPDLSHINDRQSLRALYSRVIPKDKPNTVSAQVGQIWRFMSEIKTGDMVIIPLMSTDRKAVAIGRIAGNYEYRELAPDIKHIRQVRWLKKDIPTSDFSKSVVKSFQIHLTVYRIKRDDVLNSIKNVLGKYEINDTFTIPGNEVRPDQTKIRLQTLDDVSRQTYLSTQDLMEIDELLNEKRQIIFYGPPGTGKTYVAKKFSEYFAQGIDNVEIIQFHQSYSYEDLEGIKPKLSEKDEATGFFKQSGIFKNLVKKCIENSNKKFVLIIDEINRGNISKIFGELIYLLEYRNENISLAYSPMERFHIPPNLYLIGTMNSADRSIAFVDYALRRRFYFKDFYPDLNGIGILSKWFTENNPDFDVRLIVDMLKELNQKIFDQLGKEYQIGYSYFMVKNLNQPKLNRILKFAIIPLLEQYFFGRKQKAEEMTRICSNMLNPVAQPSESIHAK